jgi:prephenate dehydrogenase
MVLSETLKNENLYEYIVAPALYRLITRVYGQEFGSGEDILGAVKQANMCCIDNVNKEAERRQRIAEGGQDASKKDASLPPKELDF